MMNRIEKIAVLKSIHEGKATIESLQPAKQFCFIEIADKPGIYLMDGNEYDVDQYFAFCESNERHTIICITKHSPSRIKGNLTLNLN